MIENEKKGFKKSSIIAFVVGLLLLTGVVSYAYFTGGVTGGGTTAGQRSGHGYATITWVS